MSPLHSNLARQVLLDFAAASEDEVRSLMNAASEDMVSQEALGFRV